MITLALAAALATSEPTVEYASAEDCAIIVAIGRSMAGWGPNGPNEPFVIDDRQADGSIYREACPWERLGVGRPKPATPGTARFAIERPVYGPGGETASAAVNFIAERGELSPFISVRQCSLRKERRRWRLLSCAQGPII